MNKLELTILLVAILVELLKVQKIFNIQTKYASLWHHSILECTMQDPLFYFRHPPHGNLIATA
jgi:hypothetical protein